MYCRATTVSPSRLTPQITIKASLTRAARMKAKVEHFLMSKDTVTFIVKARHRLGMRNYASQPSTSRQHQPSTQSTHIGDKSKVCVSTSSFKCIFIIQSPMTFFHTHRIVKRVGRRSLSWRSGPWRQRHGVRQFRGVEPCPSARLNSLNSPSKCLALIPS